MIFYKLIYRNGSFGYNLSWIWCVCMCVNTEKLYEQFKIISYVQIDIFGRVRINFKRDIILFSWSGFFWWTYENSILPWWMVNSEAKLLYIFYLRGIGVFDIWREEVRAHHLGRVEGNENSEGQNIFKKEEDFG